MKTIAEFAIVLLGVPAVWLVGQQQPWARWGFVFGVASQPFWFYLSYVGENKGIFVVSIFYSYSWIQGLYNNWFKAGTPATSPSLE